MEVKQARDVRSEVNDGGDVRSEKAPTPPQRLRALALCEEMAIIENQADPQRIPHCQAPPLNAPFEGKTEQRERV